MRAIELFAGIGGISLAMEWAGIETVAFCEREPYCQKVLNKHWPEVPIFDDIFDLNRQVLEESGVIDRGGTVDLISGGFPCQPFSVAGKRKGKEDDRDLWPQMFRLISEIRPRWVVGENVANFANMELDRTIIDLEDQGYEAQAFIIPACAVGAPHRRDRCFIVAHAHGDTGGSRRPESEGQQRSSRITTSGNDVANASSPGRKEFDIANITSESPQRAWRADSRGNQWAVEPAVGGSFDGVSSWLDGVGGLTDGAKTRGKEILRVLWETDVQEAIQWTIGRFENISKEEILLSILCEFEEESYRSGIQMESRTIEKDIMRNLWRYVESSRSSYRREYISQYARQYSNALRNMSCKASSLMPQAWKNGSWEDGIIRVSSGIKNRVDRLRCLGNAVVPQQIYPIFAAIAAIETGKGASK